MSAPPDTDPHRARHPNPAPERLPAGGLPPERWAQWLLLVLHAALITALVVAGVMYLKVMGNLSLGPWPRAGIGLGIAAALVAFGVRGVRLARRLIDRPRPPA